jgi:prepilin-type N-terminal cleavage/methylation domain-containing protein
MNPPSDRSSRWPQRSPAEPACGYPTKQGPRGFTLVELLTVVAVLGVLIALLVPTLSSARVSAQRAQTRGQFAQWAAAMELFRQEYGSYPAIATEGRVDFDKFAAALLGRVSISGDDLPADAPAVACHGNHRRLRFLDLSPADLSSEGDRLQDAFGNTEFGVRVDWNDDGRIDSRDAGFGYLAEWVAVRGPLGPPLSPADLPNTVGGEALIARIMFYSAGRGREPRDLVLSWP